MACCESFVNEARHRVAIQFNTKSSDGAGGFTSSWATVTTVWARVQPKGGREVFTEEQDQSKVTHEIIIRYNASFADTKAFGAYRILVEGRAHAVKYVQNLAGDFKNLGKEYQRILTEENEALEA